MLPNEHPPLIIPDQIIQCEVGGGFQIGWRDDAAGPFPSRTFAIAVSAGRPREARNPPRTARATAARRWSRR